MHVRRLASALISVVALGSAPLMFAPAAHVSATPAIESQRADEATIRGLVTNRAGNPIDDILVRAYLMTDGEAIYQGQDMTGLHGLYSIHDLTAGSYILEFFDFEEYHNAIFQSVYWPSAPNADDAETFTLTPGGNLYRNAVLDGVGPDAPKVAPTLTARLAPGRLDRRHGPTLRIGMRVLHVFPTGKLQVFERSKRLAQVRLTQGWGTKVQIPIRALNPGRHVLRVRYSGNAGVTPATSNRVVVRVRR